MIKRIFMVLTFVAVALAVPAVSANPAFAAPCQDSDPWQGPYWWAGLDASKDSGTRKVLAVSAPWAYDSYSYIWDYNNDPRQKWYMDCTSPDVWKMRLASDTSLCLTDRGAGFEARLWPCGWSDPGMFWERQGMGLTWTISDDGLSPTWRFVAYASRNCLDVFGGGSANGTGVGTWACHGGDNQRWY